MVKTGYISFITETGGGYSGNGNPVPATKVPSAYFECNLKVLKKEYRVYDEGQFKEAAFSVIVDNELISDIPISTIKEVILQDNNMNDLGTFQIQNVEYFSLTNQTKVVV